MSPQLTYAGVVWGGRRRQNKWIHYMNWIIWINQIHDVRRRLGLFLWKGHFAAVFYAPLAIIVVSIPVALIIYKLLFGWERHTQLTHSIYTYTKNFLFFSREIEKTYMAYILTREVLVVTRRQVDQRVFRSLFWLKNVQDLENKNNCIWLLAINCLINT